MNLSLMLIKLMVQLCREVCIVIWLSCKHVVSSILLCLVPCCHIGDSPVDSVLVTLPERNWAMTKGNNLRVSLLSTWHSTLIGEARRSQLPTQSQLEVYNSAHLTPSATSNRSNNTTPKVDVIPVSCRWPSRLAAQISTFFPPFTHCPLLTLSPCSQCGGGYPQLKQGLCWVEAARCSQDLSHYSQLHSGTRAPEYRLWGRVRECEWDLTKHRERRRSLCSSNRVQVGTFWETLEKDHSCRSPEIVV